MTTRVERRTVDLSGYPDLVVVYLGMRVNRITGIKTLFGFGPKISASVEARPAGLLGHENLIVFAVSHARGDAAVLDRCRVAAQVDALRPAPAVVAELLEGFGGDRVLARNILPARGHGSHLR
jgi:hypothetical protein